MAYFNGSTAHTQDQAAKRHILDAARHSWDDNNETPPASNFELCEHIKQRFDHEAQHNGEQAACCNWLQGLALNIEFMNHNILELAQDWGALPVNPTEKQQAQILKGYWDYMAAKTLQLMRGYHVPKD